MPKIPSLDGTSVSPQRMPDARVNVSVTPEQLAGPQVRLLRQLGKGAEEITDFVIDQQNAKDLDVVTRGETAMKGVLMERTLMTQKRVGASAAGMTAEAEQFFDSGMQPVEGEPVTKAHQAYLEIYRGADERQRSAMDALRDKQKLVHLKTVGLYEQTQVREAAIKSHEASITTDVAHATLNPYDNDQRLLSMASIRSHSQSMRVLTGEENAVTELREAQAMSSIHSGTVQKFLDNKDVVSARDYFEKFEGEILGDTSSMETSITNNAQLHEADAAAKKALEFRRQNKLGDIDDVFIRLHPEVRAKALAIYNSLTKLDDNADARAIYLGNRKLSIALNKKNSDGTYVFNSVSKLPTELTDFIAEQAGGTKKLNELAGRMANRTKIVEPTLAEQVNDIIELNALYLGGREDRLRFTKLDLDEFTLSSTNKIAFAELQEKVLNPEKDPDDSTNDNYLAEAIRNSNFDSTNDGDNEVRAQLTIEVMRRVRESQVQGDKRAPGKITPDEYRAIVDDVFKAGRVVKMKNANSRPKVGARPSVSPARQQAADFAPSIPSIGISKDKTDLRAFQVNVELFADNYVEKYGEMPPFTTIDRYMQFAKTNKGWLPGEGLLVGDKEVIIAQVPRDKQKDIYWEFDDDVIVTYGEVEGVGLSKQEADARRTRIMAYLNSKERGWSHTLENKAKAFRAIRGSDMKLQAKENLLRGKLNGASKRGLFDVFMRNDVAHLREMLKDKEGNKERKQMIERYGEEIIPLLELAIEEKTK